MNHSQRLADIQMAQGRKEPLSLGPAVHEETRLPKIEGSPQRLCNDHALSGRNDVDMEVDPFIYIYIYR